MGKGKQLENKESLIFRSDRSTSNLKKISNIYIYIYIYIYKRLSEVDQMSTRNSWELSGQK